MGGGGDLQRRWYLLPLKAILNRSTPPSLSMSARTSGDFLRDASYGIFAFPKCSGIIIFNLWDPKEQI